MRDRIIEMLGNGIPATNVAAALGVDDSYISQVVSEDGVQEEVTVLRAARFSHFAARDAKLEQFEEAALDRMGKLIPFITKSGEAARVYGVLNAAKRKTTDVNSSNAAPSSIVVLAIPESARVQLTLSSDKQVIEVAGRSMVTMQAKTLAQRLEDRNAVRMLEMQLPENLPFIPRSLVSQKV